MKYVLPPQTTNETLVEYIYILDQVMNETGPTILGVFVRAWDVETLAAQIQPMTLERVLPKLGIWGIWGVGIG